MQPISSRLPIAGGARGRHSGGYAAWLRGGLARNTLHGLRAQQDPAVRPDAR
jgi:hypothetical protein